MQEGDPCWQLSSGHFYRFFHPSPAQADTAARGLLTTREQSKLPLRARRVDARKKRKQLPANPTFRPCLTRSQPQASGRTRCLSRGDEEGPSADARERQCEPSSQVGTTSPSVIKQLCSRLEVLALWNGKSQSAPVKALPHGELENYCKASAAIYILFFLRTESQREENNNKSRETSWGGGRNPSLDHYMQMQSKAWWLHLDFTCCCRNTLGPFMSREI